ncbi:MAG: 4Fe-4S dicluster domain-containing protein [Bacteroidia bacterium]|nr:4Fe-4S dicluster domain-containing protein [Bacteroidia bacterium]
MKLINKNANRRSFLKAGLFLAGGAAATTLLKPYNAIAVVPEEPKGEKPWYGIGIDIDKCIGCGSCAKSCKIENDVPMEPFFFRSWVEQYTILNDGSVKVESPNGGLDGFTQSVPDKDVFKSFFVPKMCNHCSKSPCTQVCPVGATFESPEGVVLIDEKYCIGCRYCIQACPYGCRYLHPKKKVADKCTLCYHRIKKGMQPACFANCPTGARIFGDLHDKKSELVRFLKDHTCMVLKPHMNTGAKLFYNSLSAEVR